MEKDYTEKVCVCALNRAFGFEPAVSHGLIAAAGSAWGAFRLSGPEKAELLGPYSKIAPFLTEKELERTDRELQSLERKGCGFLTCADPGYPELLRECDDAPVGLYYRSCDPPEKVFNLRPQVAVVGTRDISLYGKEWCRKIVGAMALAEKKPLIVSGFAIGTDIIAHLAALEGGLPTVAVLPTGIDTVYPSRHGRYAETLAQTPGCAIVTDYPPDTEPKAINFIRRNRIIAGMSCGTILVESKAKGGGMITARLAASYDRDLLVLTGRADDVRSQGCNQLLREKLAEPITDTSHFLDILGLGSRIRRTRSGLEDDLERLYGGKSPMDGLDSIRSIAGFIRKNRGSTPEDICGGTGLAFAEVMKCIGILESDGIISTDLLQRCSINHKIQ